MTDPKNPWRTPWKIKDRHHIWSAGNRIICSVDAGNGSIDAMEAMAKFIVDVVNAHPAPPPNVKDHRGETDDRRT